MSHYKTVVVTFILVALCVTSPVIAETPQPLGLSDALRLARANNLELSAVRMDAEAKQARAEKVGALPNPMLSFGLMDRAEGGDWPDTDEKRIMLEQKFPWFGKRGLQMDVARRESEGAYHSVESAKLNLERSVKETFFELHSVRRSIEIMHEDEAVLLSMAEIAKSLYAAGGRSQGDVFIAESEATLLKQEVIELEARERSLEAALNSLLNRKADTPVGPLAVPPEIQLPGNLTELLARAAGHRPEVLYSLSQADRYGVEKKLMEKESMPDYQLGVEYRSLGMDEDMIMLTVGIDLPIRRSSIRAGQREAELMREASLAEAGAAERRSDLAIQDAIIALETTRRSLDLYRAELIPQAEARFKAGEAGYRNSQADFSALLDSRRFLLSARLKVAMTEGEVGKQAARLEQAAGIDLMTDPLDTDKRK